MQTLKTVFVFCLVAACAVPASFADANSGDQATIQRQNEEQIARAREAVRRKIAELNAQEPVAPVAVAPPPVVKVKPAPAPIAVPMVEIKPAPLAKPAKPAKAPKPAPEPRTAAAPKSGTPVAAAKSPQPAMSPASAGFSPIPTNPGLPPDQDEKLRESVRQTISLANAQDRAAYIDTSTIAAPVLAGTPQSKIQPTPTAFAPIAPPASSLSAAKDSRLADLLRQYKADTITPEQYHTERAKILAEP